MHLSVAERLIALNAHEFADFTAGPGGGGLARPDPWRAQLGQTWHGELRDQLARTDPTARFEVAVDLAFAWRGWTIRLTGRMDQVIARAAATLVREVKTVMRPLPAAENDLRAEFPGHFRQLAAYQCLGTAAAAAPAAEHVAPGELVFVEPATGLVQIVAQDCGAAWRIFAARLDELWAFAEQRRSGLERLRHLHFAPAFTTPRPGQETILAELREAAARSPVVLFEAPTGFGKTGSVLEYALGELAAGRLTRLLYLTGKSTGQLQVVRQLQAMLGDPPGATWWQIRNKGEHCVNEVYHCFRDACRFLEGQEERWPQSGLARFGQDPALPRDLDTLRAAGREAQVCPYEITRAALPFTDLWIADYNYIFAPANRGFLANLPGFEPAHTLLVIDEAHNLPARVADSFSSELNHRAAREALAALDGAGAPAPLVAAWEKLTIFLSRLETAERLDDELQADLDDHLALVARHLPAATLDYPALGPSVTETLFQVAGLQAAVAEEARMLPELIWVPEPGVLRFTCLDAAAAIGATLRDFGHVVFLSATLSPVDVFLRQCGLPELGVTPAHLAARTPWREGAYDVAVDVRVDTRYQYRAQHVPATAASIVALQAAGTGPVVAFFSSYAYAEQIRRQLESRHPEIRSVLQVRMRDLAEQAAFIEEALVLADVILLVLGSSFAESIDLLGGRVAGAVVVGPALPEVNAVQRAKLALPRSGGRSAGFREVYQIPGMHKVNQALGRLVRAPGQRARVLLHCQRFAGPDYQSLLAPDYRGGTIISSDADLQDWLGAGRRPEATPG